VKARLILLLIVGVAAGLLTSDLVRPGSEGGEGAVAPIPTTDAVAPGQSDIGAAVAGNETIVPDVVVRDVDGRVAWRGDVDLAPALARIEAGARDPHRNDGGVFGNRERLLPEQTYGYYREYVVRTPGLTHAGPQRLVIGQGGEVFYTSDHYASFVRIR
jgi:filamentous hemagglutinin